MKPAVVRGVAAASLIGLVALPACTHHKQSAKRRGVPDTTSTSRFDLAAVVLPVIGGSTTSTLPGGPGKATITGRVLDGAGQPVAGATVRAAWYVNAKPVQTDVQSGIDGVYQFPNVHGGVWRVRAFRPPDRASTDGQEVFLGFDEQKTLDITVQTVEDQAVTSNVAPNPPPVGSPSQLVILVSQQSVDADGRLVRAPIAGADVTLNGTGRWSLRGGSAARVTASDGTAQWELVCNGEGEQPLSVLTLNRSFDLTLPACVAEPTTTTESTAPSTTTTRPGRGTTTTR